MKEINRHETPSLVSKENNSNGDTDLQEMLRCELFALVVKFQMHR